MKKLIAVLAIIVIAIVGFAAFKGSETLKRPRIKLALSRQLIFTPSLRKPLSVITAQQRPLSSTIIFPPKTMNPQQPLPKKSTGLTL